MKLKDFDLESEGYEPGTPRPDPIGIGGENIDREVCNQATCHACGYHGLIYHPYVIPGVSYRALAECPSCGETVEF